MTRRELDILMEAARERGRGKRSMEEASYTNEPGERRDERQDERTSGQDGQREEVGGTRVDPPIVQVPYDEPIPNPVRGEKRAHDRLSA